MSVIVMCSYRPMSGKEAALDDLIAVHVPTLRRHALVTDRAPIHAVASDGTRIEVFEWASAESSATAHTIPEVASLWEAFSKVADFVPLNTLPETSGPFANFTAR